MIERAGMAAIEVKAALGTELMIALFDEWLVPLGFELGTPRDPKHRGGHIILKHPDAKAIAHALRTLKNVVPDYREPASIRLAMSPLPTSYLEVWDGLDRLRDVVASGSYTTVQLGSSKVT
jgi:kynureninase